MLIEARFIWKTVEGRGRVYQGVFDCEPDKAATHIHKWLQENKPFPYSRMTKNGISYKPFHLTKEKYYVYNYHK